MAVSHATLKFESGTGTGRLRPLAIASAKRSSMLPELPTISESGFAVDAAGWYGVLAPRGTPRSVVAKLHAEVVKTVSAPATRGRLAEQGVESVGSTPEEFAATVREEWTKWGKVIATAGLKQK